MAGGAGKRKREYWKGGSQNKEGQVGRGHIVALRWGWNMSWEWGGVKEYLPWPEFYNVYEST